jgi:hypothetical protein
MAREPIKAEVSEIPPLPEAVEVSIPLAGDSGDGPDDLVALGGTPEVELAVPELDDQFELLPASTPSGDVSSVVDLGAMWAVQDLAEDGGMTTVSIGRRGISETSLILPSRRASHLEPGSLIAVRPETIYQKKNILGLPKILVEFRPDAEADPIEADIWLPILRLHCPHHKGCEAEYAIAQSAGGEASLEVSVFGIGGGGGQSVKCTVSETYASSGECIEIAVPGKLVLQLGGTWVNGTQVAYGLRATIKDVDPKALTERPLPADHGCDVPYDQVVAESLWRLDRRNAAGEKNQSWAVKLETETEGKLSLGLELGKAPVKLGFDYVRRASAETTITTDVSAGARYAAYEPATGGRFEVFWTT